MNVKIHELLTPEAIRLDFASSPGQELDALISLACSQINAASIEASRFQEQQDELHLIHEYMSEGFGILHNLSEAVDEPLLVLALAPAGVMLKGQSYQVLAVMISPLKGSGSHFQLLAKLTSLLRNRNFRVEMLAKRSSADVLRAIKLQEESGHENYWVLSLEEILEEL